MSHNAVAAGMIKPIVSATPIDLTIVAIYFVFVIGIGIYLKKYTKTGEDFFMAGREMTAWIAGLSFLSANLGALELLGWAGSAYEYGILAVHWYWIGAIPAMLLLGLVMMPFYYASKTHSVPGYLQLRYGGATRGLSAISFAVMTILMSGVNIFAMAAVMQVVLGWDMNFSIWASSITMGVYVVLAGLLSAIFNEVLQFVLIWLGSLLIPILGMVQAGGWSGLKQHILTNLAHFGVQNPGSYVHVWSTLGHFTDNPMGINWIGIVFGLGAVISMGYWTTDFLVVQRVMSARDLRSAKMAPIIGAAFKMFVPIIVILPGLLGLGLLSEHLVSQTEVTAAAAHGQVLYSYNDVLPLMLAKYCGPGLLGLGITALIAGFMSGMAGNVTAFATVWTHDIYKPMMNPKASDAHYLAMGRWSTVLGILVSIGTAYFVMQFASIMDYVQALFSFFIAPLFGTVILGMLWKRTTAAGGFWGLLAGTASSIAMYFWVDLQPQALQYIALSPDAKPMAADMFRALWSFVIVVVVTVTVSLLTRPKAVSELKGLVMGCTDMPDEGSYPLLHRPMFWAVVISIVFVALNLYFW
ncbi:MAG: sodium:solute symporter family protein [Alphaproteobacteria bacterium]|nr:sodium:solute symporter family protein [Alphaproteobacteria bacterium]MDE1985747.1 sodium:solute symporter family protein [Alphaproteobacteria bacterium]MDE2163404.1 sodium:solute symporter family protein [Alphaproteobacteria bacterium]